MIAVKVPKWYHNFVLVWVKWSEVLSTGKFVSLLPLSLYSSFCSLLHLQSKERWKKQIRSVLFVSWFSQLHSVPWMFQISISFRKPNISSAVYYPCLPHSHSFCSRCFPFMIKSLLYHICSSPSFLSIVSSLRARSAYQQSSVNPTKVLWVLWHSVKVCNNSGANFSDELIVVTFYKVPLIRNF